MGTAHSGWGDSRCPCPCRVLMCLGEGFTGQQQLKHEQMDPVALGKALECQRLRAGAAGMGSASCASARILPDPGLGTEKGSRLNFSGAGKISFFLVSRGQELAHTWAPQHSAQVGQVPLWTQGNVSNLLETSTGKIPLGWKFPFACRLFLRKLFGPRAGSLCKSHVCFVAKLFILVALSLSGLISVSWCLPGAGSFCRG